MELICDIHRRMEKIELLPGGFIHFECGRTRKETPEDLRELFKNPGGER
jgi:hypothetical protein